MNVEWVRDLCLSFPHTTEQIQWGDALVFKVAGKIHAVTSLQPSKVWLTFKVTPENFAELTERPGIVPAPYLARAKWVGLETKDALRLPELSSLLRESYDLVVAKLPKKTRKTLSSGKGPKNSKSGETPSTKSDPPKHRRKSKKPPR